MEDPIEPSADGDGWDGGGEPASDAEVARWRKALAEDDGSPAAAGTGGPDPEPAADAGPAAAAAEGGTVIPFRPAGEAAVAEPVAAAAAGETIEAEPKGFDPGERPRRTVRPKTAAKKKKKASGLGSSALVRALVLTLATGVVGGTLFGAVVAREQAVRLVPDLAGLYALAGIEVNLRGVAIRDVVTRRDVDGATPVLVVEGMLQNISDTVRPVARIRFGLMSSTGREVYAWTMEAAKPALDPGEQLAFRSRLPAPPEAAETVEVRFADLPAH